MILTIEEQFKHLSFWDRREQTAEAIHHIQHQPKLDKLLNSYHHKDIIAYTNFTQANIDKELQRQSDLVKLAQIKKNMTPSNPHNRKANRVLPQGTKQQPKSEATTTTTELKAKLKDIINLQAEVEAELVIVELAQQKLDASRAKYKLQAEQDRLDAEAQQQQIDVLEARIKNEAIIHKLHTKLEAYTEQANQLRARIRQQLNLDRVFTNHQRTQLFLNAGGKCQLCGDSVTVTNFEADHIIPYSKGGPTTIENGQCLCRSCNRKKGAQSV